MVKPKYPKSCDKLVSEKKFQTLDNNSEETNMKKIYDYEFKMQICDTEEKKSPFAVYESEYVNRDVIDHQTGLWFTALHTDLVKAIGAYLVLTSDLCFRIFNGDYDKAKIQRSLSQLKNAGFILGIVFHNANGGRSAHKAYVLSSRGVGYLNTLGIRCRLGNFIAGCEASQLKKILSANQFLICGRYNSSDLRIAQTVLIEPQNTNERATAIFRPSGVVLNAEGEIIEFIESVRRNKDSTLALLNKLERMVLVLKQKDLANVRIANKTRLVLVTEDRAHMYDLMMNVSAELRKKLHIVYSYDYAAYEAYISGQGTEDFLYEYVPADRWSFFKKALAACL
jgi:hypothetical protein